MTTEGGREGGRERGRGEGGGRGREGGGGEEREYMHTPALLVALFLEAVMKSSAIVMNNESVGKYACTLV